MHSSNGSPAEERSGGSVSACRPPRCPVCEGALVPLRGQYRCARCYFSICAGCEGVSGYPPGDAGD
jgi:hypothetical protein